MADLGLSGVFSGIDTSVMVASAMAYNRLPLNRLNMQKAEWQAKDNAMADLESRLAFFKAEVDSLRSDAVLENTIASSLDTTILTASASGGAIEGTHEVIINQLAQTNRFVHDTGLAETTTTVGVAKSTALNLNGAVDPDATWFTTSANGATYTFDFGDENDITGVVLNASTGYSMNQVASLINVQSQAVSGYDAATVEVDGQTGKSYLSLTAQTGAAEGAMTQTLTAGDAVDELNDAADWTKTAAGTGTFAYTYDSVSRSISVSDDTTLADLVELINNDAQNPGVSASLLEYGSAYHLVLAGKDTGTSHNITVDNLGTTIEGFDSTDFIETQAAQDLQVRVDGYPPADWITRDSNTMTDVIPNVTVTARAAGTTSINVNRDTNALQLGMENLVEIYNGLVDKINAYAGYNDASETGGILQGDSSITRLLDSLRAGITSAVPGFLSGTDTYTMASEIGLEFGKRDANGLPMFDEIGKLALDKDALASALTNDYQGVLNLIGGAGTGASDIDDVQFSSSHDSTEGGNYNVRIDFDASGEVTAARIKKDSESEWRDMTIDGDTLSGLADNPEQFLNLTAVWDGSGAYTANADVRVRQGFGNVLYDRVSAITDTATGVLGVKREQYSDAMDAAEKNIERQERLLETKQIYLEEKYARLEAALARLDSQRAVFDAVFASVRPIGTSSEE
ncbi:MAG: flagellar filament capping protein FliD [Phycisphaerales bacterium]|jgi:flagellar hook-associated protein 2|nr:flagellar filament capping protein FliD [Phycisphaerales bacterium]